MKCLANKKEGGRGGGGCEIPHPAKNKMVKKQNL